MGNLSPGQLVDVPCEVQRGAFPTEYLVTIETAEGPISGFIRKDDVQISDQHHRGYIPATVVEISAENVTVKLRGSFFTTTGLANVRRDLISSHNHAAAHA